MCTYSGLICHIYNISVLYEYPQITTTTITAIATVTHQLIPQLWTSYEAVLCFFYTCKTMQTWEEKKMWMFEYFLSENFQRNDEIIIEKLNIVESLSFACKIKLNFCQITSFFYYFWKKIATQSKSSPFFFNP